MSDFCAEILVGLCGACCVCCEGACQSWCDTQRYGSGGCGGCGDCCCCGSCSGSTTETTHAVGGGGPVTTEPAPVPLMAASHSNEDTRTNGDAS